MSTSKPRDPFENPVVQHIKALNELAGKLYAPSFKERRSALIEIGEQASELEHTVEEQLTWRSFDPQAR